jgi:pyrroline-5-carboxylate reductase
MAGPLLLVGCGRMGSALLEGWLARGVKSEEVKVVEPAAADAARRHGIAVVADAAALPAAFAPEVVVLAVKPQVMEQATLPLVRFARPGAVMLSIAAGKTIAGFAARFGDGAAIVRAMPNTPAAVGRGVTAACANRQVSAALRQRCDALLAAVGDVIWIDDEALLDAVTAVSGSGPAYVFLLIECLADAGIAAGLAPDVAARLARATVCGSGELAFRSTEAAATLRQNVTSPGGTTQAALDILMAPDGLRPLLVKAVAAAARRSRELAG